jgi:hypothetical protein
MRLTVLSQYARGVAHHDEAESARLLAALDSIKWLLWHGNQHRVGEELAFFEDDVDGLEVGYPNLGKFKRAAREFVVYIGSKRRQPDQLPRAVPLRRAHLVMPGREHGERRHQQALCQASADAVDQARRAPAAADPNANPRRHAPPAVRAMASGVGCGFRRKPPTYSNLMPPTVLR